jgi:hypothetical protein
MRAYEIALFAVLTSLTHMLSGQVLRIGALRPRPQLTLGDTLTVTASPSVVNFTLHPSSVATGSAPVVITTTWSGVSLLSSINLYGYFASATSALSGSSPVINIPSSCVLGQVTTGTPVSYTAFTGSGPFGGAGASLQLYAQSSFLSLGGSRTDNLNLEINIASLPQLPAATYTGTLILEAQAF